MWIMPDEWTGRLKTKQESNPYNFKRPAAGAISMTINYHHLPDTQFTRDVPGAPDIQTHILCFEELQQAASLHITECYSGSVVGTGNFWADEFSYSYHLAIARALLFDYELSIEALP